MSYNFIKRNYHKNYITRHVRSLMKGPNIYKNPELFEVSSNLINNGCIYYQNFMCKKNDYKIFNSLKNELGINQEGMDNCFIDWSKHKKHPNPCISHTYQNIIEDLINFFDIEILETRLNYYKDGKDWKPYHQDRNAFSNRYGNYTIGVSFGFKRDLSFRYLENNDIKFNFPQGNGDLFAFNSQTNKLFEHGVPIKKGNTYERISIILWGII